MPVILLMGEILHQLIGSLPHYLQDTSQVVQDFFQQYSFFINPPFCCVMRLEMPMGAQLSGNEPEIMGT